MQEEKRTSCKRNNRFLSQGRYKITCRWGWGQASLRKARIGALPFLIEINDLLKQEATNLPNVLTA